MARSRIAIAIRRTLEWFVFGALPIAIFCWWLTFSVFDGAGDWAFDFRPFWQAGNDVLHGISPYGDPAAVERAGDDLDSVEIQEIYRFVYPAGSALAFVPFGALDYDVATAIWGGVLITSLFAAMWIIGVSDWRVMGVVIGSAPVIGAVRIGTVTPVLILLVAVAWRWRDRSVIAGASIAAAVALKLFLWPMVAWLVATRRWLAAGLATGLASLVTLAAWGAIGFDGFTDYPTIVRELSDVVADDGFSLVALGREAGLPEIAADVLMWVVGLALLATVFLVARRADPDRRAFSVAIVAAIALTPIVWLHYFAFLVVPLALARPRLSWAWGVIWVLWLVPAQENDGELWRVLLGVSVAATVLAATLSPSSPATTPRTARRQAVLAKGS